MLTFDFCAAALRVDKARKMAGAKVRKVGWRRKSYLEYRVTASLLHLGGKGQSAVATDSVGD